MAKKRIEQLEQQKADLAERCQSLHDEKFRLLAQNRILTQQLTASRQACDQRWKTIQTQKNSLENFKQLLTDKCHCRFLSSGEICWCCKALKGG